MIRRGHIERYIEKYEKSKSSGDVRAQITYCSKLSFLFSHFGMYEYAEVWKQKGIKKSEQYGYEEDFSTLESVNIYLTNQEKAKILIEQKEYDEALIYLEKALGYAKEIGSDLYQIEINRDLSKIYEEKGNYQKALKYLESMSYHRKKLIKDQSALALIQNRYSKIKKKTRIYEKQYKDIDNIYSICQKISSKLKYEEIVEMLYSEAGKLFNLDTLFMARYNSESSCIDKIIYVENGETKHMKSFFAGEGISVGEYSIRNNKSILINDRDKEYSKYVDLNNINIETDRIYPQSMIYCPMYIGERPTGYISIQNHKKQAYKSEDVYKLETVAAYLSIALENSDLYHKLEHSSNYDFLTGLSSRKEIFVRGKNKYYECAKLGRYFSVIMIDIDYLKKINDTYGHRAGDQLIVEVANIIKLNSRAADISARYGGEEFVILLPDTDLEGAERVAERIRGQFEKHAMITDSGHNIFFTGSFGVYQYSQTEIEEFEHGLKKVDEALYKAKQSGRNRISHIK